MGAELSGAGPGPPKRIDIDPQLDIELKVCHHYRVFHSEFLARSQDDRDKAIWQYSRQHGTCQHCGTRSEEWYTDAGEFRPAYIAQLMECEGCVVRLRGEQEFANELQDFRGVHVGLIRNPEVP